MSLSEEGVSQRLIILTVKNLQSEKLFEEIPNENIPIISRPSQYYLVRQEKHSSLFRVFDHKWKVQF